MVDATDWVEHVLATGGEAYLRTPDEDLPLIVRLSLDVWAACLGTAAVLLYAAFALLKAACNILAGGLSNGGKKKSA